MTGRWRAAGAWAVALALMLAALAGAGSVGTRERSTAPLRSLPAAGPLGYHEVTGARFQRLNQAFVNSALGLTAPPAAPATVVPFGTTQLLGPIVSSPLFHCVAGHQTADPQSPPCVARFTGPNGGATYAGVSDNEIRVLVTDLPGVQPASLGNPHILTGFGSPIFDLGKPPQPGEDEEVATFRLWQAYFNATYQLYGRRVHLFVQYVDPWGSGEEEAHEALVLVRPYAVIAYDGFTSSYLAQNGIVSFIPTIEAPASHYTSAPSFVYGYLPPAEHVADLYASYVCQKVVNHPVAISGTPADNGKPRKLGWLNIDATNDIYGEAAVFQTRALAEIRRCGGVIAATSSGPRYACDLNEQIAESFGATAASPAEVTDVLRFKSLGITTILGASCPNDVFGTAASAVGYSPEWVFLGHFPPTNLSSPTELALMSRHSVAVTAYAFSPGVADSACYRAERQVDPHKPADASAVFACFFYPGLRQVVTGLQLAGPRLTPAAMVTGLRTLPLAASPNPQLPECAYPPGDFTCVKDAQVELWDNGAHCYRSIEGGRRYLPWAWPPGNVDAQFTGKEPCDQQGGVGN